MSLLALNLKNEAHKEINQLLGKMSIEKPGERDVGALRVLLGKHPEVWQEGTDLTSYVIENCIDRFYSNSPVVREIIILKIEAVKQDLDWQNSCSVERLLIGNVVLSYLRWLVIGSFFDQTLTAAIVNGMSDYWTKQLAASNRNYLRAIEALTKFRSLARSTPSLRRDLTSEIVM